MAPNLALVGFMASGKSTVGRICSERLGFAFLDTDKLVEDRSGMSVREVFEQWGEPRFREMETAAVELAAMRDRVVIATGGGAVLLPRNVEALRARCVVVYLSVSPQAVMERTEGDTSRPLLETGSEAARRLGVLLGQREPYYRSAAHAVVDGQSELPAAIAQRVISAYRGVAVRWFDLQGRGT